MVGGVELDLVDAAAGAVEQPELGRVPVGGPAHLQRLGAADLCGKAGKPGLVRRSQPGERRPQGRIVVPQRNRRARLGLVEDRVGLEFGTGPQRRHGIPPAAQ